MIQGIRFRVTQRGSKLVKVPGDINPASATPKITFVGGVKFHRSKNGNLYRDGILKAQRQTGIKKVNEPCRTFASTGIFLTLLRNPAPTPRAPANGWTDGGMVWHTRIRVC